MGVQVTKSCEERTLYVWPGWPVPLKVTGAPAEAQIWSVGGITSKGWMRYRHIGRLVPAGSVKVNEPLASGVTVPITVQTMRSFEARTLYVWPAWPAPLKVTVPSGEAQIWRLGVVTWTSCRRYRHIGRLVPAGSVKGNEPRASGVTVPITVQTLRSCEARTLYVWPASPVPVKINDPPGTLWIWRAIGGTLFVGKGTV